MDATQLGRWTRFAAKGGIGKCTAVQDCVAEQEDDLMFLKDDDITVLMQLAGQDDMFLGYCEGVVGRFRGVDVRFHGRLKKPVVIKRSSSTQSGSRPSSSMSAATLGGRESVPPNVARSSPSLPVSSSTSRISYSRSASSSTMPESSSQQFRSPSPALYSPLPVPSLSPDEGSHLRSVSYSSISTALESAPRTPADFSFPEKQHEDNIRIVQGDRQVESPTELNDDDGDVTLRVEKSEEITPSSVPSGSPTPSVSRASVTGSDSSKRDSSSSTEEGGPPEEPSTFLDSETSARLSRLSGLSDGEVGIGLSLLQDFLNGGDDDDADSVPSARDSVKSRPADSSTEDVPGSPSLTVEGHGRSESTTADSTLAESMRTSSASPTTAKLSTQFDVNRPNPPSSSSAPSIRSMSSRTSTHPTDSEYGGEEWEGASDIYDNYRYSRFSMASKMSMTSSRRLSKGSMHTVASGFGLEVPPPVPTDGPRISGESVRSRTGSAAGRMGSGVSSVDESRRPSGESSRNGPSPSAGSSSPIVDAVVPRSLKDATLTASNGSEAKRVPPPLTFAPGIISSTRQDRPPPLNLVSEPTASPLLHSAFGSPLSSNSPQSTAAFLSPGLPGSPTYSTPGGIASALRQRLELERTSPSGQTLRMEAALNLNRDARLSSQPIVVEDDEEPRTPMSPRAQSTNAGSPDHRQSQSSLYSSPTSPSASLKSPTSSSFFAEKQALQSTFHIANPAPPPPYTPLSPTAASSSIATTRPTPDTSPQPQSPPQPQAVPRPFNSNQRPQGSSSSRQSLFLPHPHAPKPTASPTGPMYGRQPTSSASPLAFVNGPPPGSVIHTIHMALATRFDPNRGQPWRTTIYGKLEHEWSNSIGPVPISFTLEPPNNVPANRVGPNTNSPSPVPPQSLPSVQPRAEILVPTQTQESVGESLRASQSTPATNGLISDSASGSGKAIPRANFFPNVQKPRPRSRSFSGFDSPFPEAELPKDRSSEDDKQSIQMPPVQTLSKRSKSASATVSAGNVNPIPQRASVSHGPPNARSVNHGPSPLSLSQNNIVASPLPKSPTTTTSPSPVSAAPMVATANASSGNNTSAPVVPLSPTKRLAHKLSIGQVSLSSKSSRETPSSPITVTKSISLPFVNTTTPPADTSSPTSSPTRRKPVLRHSRSSLSNRRSSVRDSSPQSRSSIQGRQSIETDVTRSNSGSGVRSSPSFGTSPPSALNSLGRSGSLRSKLSLPTLRIRNNDRPSFGEDRSPTLSTAPNGQLQDQRTVQVKDMDFELVKPSLPAPSVASASDDLSLPPTPSPINPDAPSSLRADSPALSTISGSSSRTRPPVSFPSSDSKPSKPTDLAEIEAHRQRELRWISAMSSIPASQARKSKKIRKLLQEGVPSSVRYLVWAHLTDSKAKRMDGLYSKLGKRERVGASASIERDVQQYFTEQPQLQDGSLVNLLQAFLTMVPDIRYSRGLASIAGCLLLQSPEEDAFWTFISLIDSHLRAYFSSASVQLEVDASLFGKAQEVNDSAVAKKVFVDMAITPVALCRPWFTSLFVDVLPAEYMHRLWDIFLFEGVTFLFRVGLAIFSCCKQSVLATAGRDAVLSILLHPPAACLPSTPDAFLDLAFSLKLKDEDVRKQRNKMESQVKRHTQSRALTSQNGLGTTAPPISLPKS